MEETVTTIVNLAEWILEGWNWFSDQLANTSAFVIDLLPERTIRQQINYKC